SNIALLIGVQNYGKDSGWPALRTPINDIRKLRNLLVHEYHFNPDNVHMLSNASYQAILDSLRLLRDKVDERTNLLVYYAGHGLVDEDGEYFWIPSDGGRSPKTWIYTEYILKKIKNLNSLHTLLVVDSCFSGALNEHESRSRTDHGVRKLYRKTSRQLITAGGNEPVADGGGTQNSVFARSFLEILQNQPDDQPLSTQELFSKLQPVVADMSNQTPTYDRIPNSRDQWGQFYFFKNPQAVALIDKDDGKTESGAVTSVEDLPATIVDSLNLSKSDEARGSVAELLFQRDETLIDTRDIVESEQVTLLGALVSFGIRIKTFPVSIQMKYASGEKNRTDTVVYGQKEYTVPEAISCIDMLIGLRSVNNNNPTRWISEIGLYYHWKRIQVEWDTSTLVVKKTDSEYVNRGYHLLDLQNFKAWKANEHLALGLNTNFLLGLVTVSGSTQVARNEKYNKDVANLILGTSLGPEMRFRFPTVHVDMRVGSNLEYLWQPQDDKGGSKAGPNKINATLYTSKIYATFGLGF
ncbi:MAG: caspase family protein, partial [Proteobacteria bacterium]|nr:caspase family protein [Pseudomonadota bacterium]